MVAIIPVNVQKMEFDVTTAEGPSRATIVSGMMPFQLSTNSASGVDPTQRVTLTALVDPKLTPGQFRMATATAALVDIAGNTPASGTNTVASFFRCLIDNVEATLDDESGQDSNSRRDHGGSAKRLCGYSEGRVPGDHNGEAVGVRGVDQPLLEREAEARGDRGRGR